MEALYSPGSFLSDRSIRSAKRTNFLALEGLQRRGGAFARLQAPQDNILAHSLSQRTRRFAQLCLTDIIALPRVFRAGSNPHYGFIIAANLSLPVVFLTETSWAYTEVDISG